MPEATITATRDHLMQARAIIEGKGRGSSFPPDTTTVGQLLLALEALLPHLLTQEAEVARLRNRVLELEARVARAIVPPPSSPTHGELKPEDDERGKQWQRKED